MKQVIVIDTLPKLNMLCEELAKHSHIAVDTESNSFHAYFERICLMQISTAEDDFIVDPLALGDLRPLGAIFHNPAIEKIFHAASNDIFGLKRDFKLGVENLFDTAVACQLLGFKKLGLAKIIEKHFGVILNKKLQRHDWSKRPLNQDELNYARLDTHFLIPLRFMLAADLMNRNLWESAAEGFEKVCQQRITQRVFHPENFKHLRGAHSLDSEGKRLLKALFVYRENEARRCNRAPFRILSDETLVRLAHEKPQSINEILQTKGLPRSFRGGSRAHTLLGIIRKSTGVVGKTSDIIVTSDYAN